jgi:diguanylate cyclase
VRNKKNHTELRLVGNGSKAAVALPPDAPAIPRDYQARIERYAERIRSSRNPSEIATILGDALRDTHALTASENADDARLRIADAERQIAALKAELEAVTMLLHTDPLTGALNRRGIEDAYRREAARADRHAAPLAVGIIDLDNFKNLNDCHGHQAGDDALVLLARTVRQTLRPNDSFGRFGGEEFVVMLPDTKLDHARRCLQRLQEKFASAHPLPGARRVAVTFSAGVTQRLAREPFEQTLSRADHALYEAKRAGKNRVIPAA